MTCNSCDLKKDSKDSQINEYKWEEITDYFEAHQTRDDARVRES